MPVPPPASAPASQRVSPSEKPPLTAEVNGSFNEKTSSAAPKTPLLSPLVVDSGNDMGPGGSTGKAKKVMDWFRKRSLAKNGGDSVFSPVQTPSDPQTFRTPSQDAEPPTPTIDTYRAKPNRDSNTSLSAPQVVITAAEGQIATWGPTPRSASGQSHTSTDTSASAHSATKGGPTAGVTPAATSSHIPPVAKRAAEALANVAFRNPPAAAATRAFNKTMLRVHHGAVDQATITTGSPPEVFEHVTKVLISMGIEIQRESEFKYRCIRHKKKKLAGLGIKESSTSSSLSAFAMSGSAASNGVSI